MYNTARTHFRRLYKRGNDWNGGLNLLVTPISDDKWPNQIFLWRRHRIGYRYLHFRRSPSEIRWVTSNRNWLRFLPSRQERNRKFHRVKTSHGTHVLLCLRYSAVFHKRFLSEFCKQNSTMASRQWRRRCYINDKVATQVQSIHTIDILCPLSTHGRKTVINETIILNRSVK